VQAEVAAGRAGDVETLVFINYRSSDTAPVAAFLHAELADRFGTESVFLDYESIPLGRDFAPELLSRVRGSAVLLVVVGDRWLDGAIGQRPIDRPDDWVRKEIVEALAHGVPVAPVLVSGGKLDPERLPDELVKLASFQYYEIRNRRMRHDIRGLCDHLVRQVPRLRDRPVPRLSPRQAARYVSMDREVNERAAAELRLRDSGPRALLSVATLKPDPMALRADHALDWVDRFEGTSDYLKRRPLVPWTWVQLQDDIEAIPQHLPADRAEVLLTGSLRQATAFAVGAALRMVTGRDVAVNQRGQLWASNTPFDAPIPPVLGEHRINAGDDLAVAIAVATDLTADVLAFINAEELPVERLVTMRPSTGISDNAIPDAATAAAFTHGCRDAVRTACRRNRRVHLFLAGPIGLTLLLGHRWNCVRRTVVYEDVQGPFVYEKAFTVDA
jgi:SMODS-associated and fused to various effectors sensor domain/TIR domain